MNRPNLLVRLLARLLRPVILEALTPESPATKVSASWFNDIQEEIARAVREAGAGEAPDARLAEAITRLERPQ